jgi:hypothetical protein
VSISACISCSTENKTDGKNAGIDGKTGKLIIDSNELKKKYLSEGFISGDIFRIVIMAPKNDSTNNLSELEEKAKKRANSTLQNYLASENKTINQNVKAGILDLINNNGTFSQKEMEWDNNNIFYFEINKENLKKQVRNLGAN